MNRVDLQSRLQNNFNNSTYYTVDDLNNSIQDGLDEIVPFTGCVYKSAAVTFGQFTTYYDFLTLLPDYVGLVALFNNVIRRWMWPTSLRKLNQVRIDWDVAYGTPEYFCPINHRYIAIYKKPAIAHYGQMLVFYLASAPTLGDSTEIPIPDEYVTVLESYSKADLWEQAQEWGKAGVELKNYIESLEELRLLMKSKRNRDRLSNLR